MSLSATAALAVQLHSLRTLFSLITDCADDSSLYSHHGIHAAIVPAAPEQPMVNAATYASGTSLRDHLQSLASAYRRAGVRTWAIWVPESDADTSVELRATGHVQGDRLPAMILDLTHLDPTPLAGLDYDATATVRTLASVNQQCYHNGTGLLAAFAKHPGVRDLRVYQARHRGETACVLLTHDQPTDHGTSCATYFVATLPHARRQHLAARLLTAALLHARDRGCTLSALQASAMGTPLYTALGYRTAFHYLSYTSRP